MPVIIMGDSIVHVPEALAGLGILSKVSWNVDICWLVNESCKYPTSPLIIRFVKSGVTRANGPERPGQYKVTVKRISTSGRTDRQLLPASISAERCSEILRCWGPF